MDINIEYLLYYLEDELKDIEDLRIHPVAPAGTKKSPDLVQDYDPNENNIHNQRGVRIRAGSREFFFPASWVENKDFDQVQAQAKEVREYCLSKFK